MLLEREPEIESLGDVVDAALGHRGGVAIVEGEAGIGKTSLLEATAARAGDEGARVLRSRGTALEHGFGFGIVRQLLERVLLQTAEDERAALLAGPAAVAAPAIGLDPLTDPPAGGDGAFAVLHGLYRLVCELAGRAPVVLVIDDAQWSDVPSLRWVSYLAGRLDGVAVAVLLGWRTGEPDAPVELLESVRAEAATRTVSPQAFSRQGSAAVVRAAIGDDADPQLCDACHQATGGNPFLMRAVVDALQGDTAEPQHVQRLGPAAVQRQLLLRLARLEAGAGALARAVSVLDADAEPRFAYALAGLDADTAASAAAALQDARILDVGDALRFAHPILRAAVYEDLPAAARAAAHRRASEVLDEQGGDPDRAAVHLLATEPSGDAAVADRLDEAARRALHRGAPEMSLALLERALAEPASAGRRPSLLLAAGRAARILTRPDALTYLIEAHRSATDARSRVAAAAELGQASLHARPDEGVDVLRRALAGLGPDERERADRIRLDLLTTESTASLRAPGVIEDDLRALHREARPASPARLGAACLLLWHQHLWAEHPQADEVAELARELTDIKPLIDTYGADFMPIPWGASVLAEWNHPDVAAAAFAAVMDAAQRTGNALASLAASSRGVISAWCGDFASAEADARAALESATAAGAWTPRRGALGTLVWALTGRGAYEEIEEHLAAHGLDGDFGQVRSTPVDGNLLLARSTLRRFEGRYAEACDDVHRALEGIPAGGPINRIKLWGTRGLAVGGERELALAISRRAVATARAGGLQGSLGIALHSAGLAERGERSIEILDEAVRVLADTPLRWEHAEALVDLGAAMRRANRRAAARPSLREGCELAERIGALALAERARQELVRTGARARSTARTGVNALTPSELRVVEAAARGVSIAEIAGGLFVARKTVESHLYSAYRKLGVSSRAELAVALAAHRHR